MRKDALISACGLYRYSLIREWAPGDRLGFIMLNPSTADAKEDDATIRRCIGFARLWGYGGIVVGNLFALRSKDPAALREAVDAVGPVNDKMLVALSDEVKTLVAGWGAHPFAAERARKVCGLLPDRLSCLGVTKAGHPKHPLYLRADTQPVKFDPKGLR